MRITAARRSVLLVAVLSLAIACGSGEQQAAPPPDSNIVQAEPQNATGAQVCDLLLGESVDECVQRHAQGVAPAHVNEGCNIIAGGMGLVQTATADATAAAGWDTAWFGMRLGHSCDDVIDGTPIPSLQPSTRSHTDFPYCDENPTFAGNSGAIHYQKSSTGYVPWGIDMYDPKDRQSGYWNMDVYVDSTRVDHKEQSYQPHGRVNPVDVKAGQVISIRASYTDTDGNRHRNVRNGCIY